MTQINFNSFIRAAQSDTSGNRTIKLGGENGVKHVGWHTWKSTNRVANNAFMSAIRNQFGEAMANAISRNLGDNFVNKPLTSRRVMQIKEAIDFNMQVEQTKKNNFLNGGEIHEIYQEAMSHVSQTMPQELFEHFEESLRNVAAEHLNRDFAETKQFDEDAAKNDVKLYCQQMGEALCRIYDLSSNNGKPLTKEMCARLSTCGAMSSVELGGFLKFFEEMANKTGSEAILARTQANALKLYTELCKQSGVSPIQNAAGRSMEELENAFNQLLKNNMNDNSKTEGLLGQIALSCSKNKWTDKANNLEAKSLYNACMDAMAELRNERPELKTYIGEIPARGDRDNLENLSQPNHFFLLFRRIKETLANRPAKVTPENIKTLVKEKIAEQSMLSLLNDKCRTQLVGKCVVPGNKQGQTVIDRLGQDNIDICIEQTGESFIKNYSELFHRLANAPAEASEADMKTSMDLLQNILQYTIDSQCAQEDTAAHIKAELMNQCKLSNEEAETIDLRQPHGSFAVIDSNLRKKAVETGAKLPTYEDLMAAFTPKRDKFINLKKELIAGMDTLKGKISDNQFKEMRANAIALPEYIFPNMLTRAYEIASKLDVTIVKTLEHDMTEDSIQDAFRYMGLQVFRMKEAERTYEPHERQRFMFDVIETCLDLHPEILTVLKGMPKELMEKCYNKMGEQLSNIAAKHANIPNAQKELKDSVFFEYSAIRDGSDLLFNFFGASREAMQNDANLNI